MVRQVGPAALATLAVLSAACGAPRPVPSGRTMEPTAAPRPPLVIGTETPIRSLSQTNSESHAREARRMVYSGLYRIDADLLPAPDLAAAPCETADVRTWMCRLRPATFHDGTPVTADDVAFTYELADELAAVGECPDPSLPCLTDVVESVLAVDRRTVEFRLEMPYAPFEARVLPTIGIDSRAAVESAFEALSAAAAQFDLGALGLSVRRIAEAGEGDCAGAVARAEAVLRRVGLDAVPRDAGLDACSLAAELASVLDRLITSQQADGLAAIAAAYPLLSREPIGSGPFRCRPGCLRDDGSVWLAAFDEYHGGRPAASAIEMRYSAEYPPGGRVADGAVDWVRSVPADDPVLQARAPTVKLAEYVELGYVALQYNVREDALFSDLNLRKAMQLCIDKPATVAGATHGTGVPIETPIPPASWAHHSRLPAVDRDVDAARQLIESSGWRLGGDGVYVDGDGRRLATQAWVRAGRPDRFQFMQSVAEQVSDCGIEIQPMDADVLQSVIGFPGLLSFPHTPPGGTRAWDLYFGGWSSDADPDIYEMFHSSQCTTEEQPSTFNYICYTNPRVDELLEEARATPDRDERRVLYLQVQEILAEEQPYLFAWAGIQREALDANLTSTTGELDLTSPMWDWQPETLFVQE